MTKATVPHGQGPGLFLGKHRKQEVRHAEHSSQVRRSTLHQPRPSSWSGTSPDMPLKYKSRSGKPEAGLWIQAPR